MLNNEAAPASMLDTNILILSNVCVTITEDQFLLALRRVAEVDEVRLMHANGISRGYGFAYCRVAEEADKVLAQFDRTKLGNRVISVGRAHRRGVADADDDENCPPLDFPTPNKRSATLVALEKTIHTAALKTEPALAVRITAVVCDLSQIFFFLIFFIQTFFFFPTFCVSC